jgi:hypothetical protein
MRRKSIVRLRHQSLHHLCRIHPREAEVEALEAVAELLVIEAEEMQDRCVEVVHGHGITGDMPGEVVGLPIDLAAFDAAAGHPEAEGTRMMIAAGDLLEALAVLTERSAAELAAPHDERGVEQATLFQILQQRGDGLIDHLAVVCELRIEATVMIPRSMDDVHEAHAALDHASRLQALARERLEITDATEVALDGWFDAIHAVGIERGLRFAGEIDQFRR